MFLIRDFADYTIKALKLINKFSFPDLDEAGRQAHEAPFKMILSDVLIDRLKDVQKNTLKKIQQKARVVTRADLLNEVDSWAKRMASHPRLKSLENPQFGPYNWVKDGQPGSPESIKAFIDVAFSVYLTNKYWHNEHNPISLETPEKTVKAFIEIVVPVIEMDTERAALVQFHGQPDWDFTALQESPQNEVERSPEAENPPFKVTAKHYALAFILDCLATSKKLPTGKKAIEQMAIEIKFPKDPNTFYKNFNPLNTGKVDFNSELDLIDIGGENWREIVLSLSKFPDELEKYLKTKQL
jgi:hypothetical protein